MAGLGNLLQRIARSLEEAGAQQPGDDLRARLGYGTDDEDEPASNAVWEPEGAPDSAVPRRRPTAWEPETVRRPEASGTPGRTSATPQASATHQAPLARSSLGGGTDLPVTLPHFHASPRNAISERIHARLRTPDGLREAFVLKEILDRPLPGRRGR